MFNPVTKVCDWPSIVQAVRPYCAKNPPKGPKRPIIKPTDVIKVNKIDVIGPSLQDLSITTTTSTTQRITTTTTIKTTTPTTVETTTKRPKRTTPKRTTPKRTTPKRTTSGTFKPFTAPHIIKKPNIVYIKPDSRSLLRKS